MRSSRFTITIVVMEKEMVDEEKTRRISITE